MVANHPKIVADGTERLHCRLFFFELVECVVVGQRCALNGIAHISDVQILTIRSTHFLDVGGNTCQAALVRAAFTCGSRVVGCIDLTVQI